MKSRNKKIILALAVSFLMFPFFSSENDEEVLFRFKFNKDDKSRILSTVDEEVYIEGNLSHQAKILNRISSVVTSVYENGNGITKATFMTSESAKLKGDAFTNYTWGEEYESIFERTPLGKYTISDIYFMPTVRDVPLFPSEPVKKGQIWTGEGHEAHDLRRGFNASKPFKVPFVASYCWKDTEEKENGTKLYVIEARYDLYFESPEPDTSTNEYLNFPAVTMGHSYQTIWWDNDRGMIDHYSEEFKISITSFYGTSFVFVGTAHAEVNEFQRVSSDETVMQVRESVERFGLENVEVRKGEKGLVISVENIQFKPDSSELLESEKVKLNKIGDILKLYTNDILVTGHCAARGTKPFQQKISEERASAVASYLTQLGVRKSECIFTIGKGASMPIAPNSTEDGRARNRRVEITLMDN